MDKNYEYHKQNDYPGERAAEKKRVSDRKEEADKKTELGPLIITVLLLILIASFSWSLFSSQKQADEIDSLNKQLDKYESGKKAEVLISTNAEFAADKTRPTVLYVNPMNNKHGVPTDAVITVKFSEPMDLGSLNKNTFKLKQRTTPQLGDSLSEYRSIDIEGIVTSDGQFATFTPEKSESYNPMQPNQRYGNVFTATITKGAKDISGNQIIEDYVWSFTTGNEQFNTGKTTSQTNQ